MSPQIERKKQIAIKVADTINSIEGAPVTAYAKELSTKWAKGEISGEDMKAKLIAVHKKQPSEELTTNK